MANRKLQKMLTYQLAPQSDMMEHEKIQEYLKEGWDVKHFEVNQKDDAMGMLYVTVLLEHTSKNPESQW
jgi:hypothetical protein